MKLSVLVCLGYNCCAIESNEYTNAYKIKVLGSDCCKKILETIQVRIAESTFESTCRFETVTLMNVVTQQSVGVEVVCCVGNTIVMGTSFQKFIVAHWR